MRLRFAHFTLIPLTALWLTACSAAADSTPEIFRPPSPAGVSFSPVPTVPPVATAVPTNPSLECTDNLSYLEDLTVPDGSLVLPGQAIDKRWLVENNGTCNWDEGYRLKLIAGDALGASPEQALFPARAGAQVTLRILFTAPLEAGTYRSAWQAFDPQGELFGDPIFIEIVVEG